MTPAIMIVAIGLSLKFAVDSKLWFLFDRFIAQARQLVTLCLDISEAARNSAQQLREKGSPSLDRLEVIHSGILAARLN